MFFPLFKALELDGFLELGYVAANNWENRESRDMNVYALWPDGQNWRSELFDVIENGKVLRIFST